MNQPTLAERLRDTVSAELMYEPANIAIVHALIKALQAHTLYKKDDRYIVKDGEVILL